MKDQFHDTLWRRSVQLWRIAKRLGVLGPMEPVLLGIAPFIVPPFRKEVEITLPWGMRMIVPPGYTRARSYGMGLYEPDTTSLLGRILRERLNVVDLGANIGYYTLLASKIVGDFGRVYAFEPDPRNYRCLIRNVRANNCSNVLALEKAAYKRTTNLDLVLDPTGAESSLSKDPAKINKFSVSVETVSLDDFFGQREWPPIELVKMDIEGGEEAALEGMTELCRRNPKMKLIMEFNLKSMRRNGVTPQGLLAILQELGFHTGFIIERGLIPFLTAEGIPRIQGNYNLLLEKG